MDIYEIEDIAEKECFIIGRHGVEPFMGDIPACVITNITKQEKGTIRTFKLLIYGYILGIRAERARRKKVKK